MACSPRKFCPLPAPPLGTVYTVVDTSQTLAGRSAGNHLYGWEKAETPDLAPKWRNELITASEAHFPPMAMPRFQK